MELQMCTNCTVCTAQWKSAAMYQDAAELWSDDSLSGCFVALEKNQLIHPIDDDDDYGDYDDEEGDDDFGDDDDKEEGDDDADEGEISCWSLPSALLTSTLN